MNTDQFLASKPRKRVNLIAHPGKTYEQELQYAIRLLRQFGPSIDAVEHIRSRLTPHRAENLINDAFEITGI